MPFDNQSARRLVERIERHVPLEAVSRELDHSRGKELRRDPARSTTRRILVVDDEELVLAIASRMLRSAGYACVEAASARQALGILERRATPVDLVITDVVMPETDGPTLGLLIAERYPGLPVVYMSAYAANDVFHRGSPGPNVPFLSKPFSPEALFAMVEASLAS